MVLTRCGCVNWDSRREYFLLVMDKSSDGERSTSKNDNLVASSDRRRMPHGTHKIGNFASGHITPTQRVNVALMTFIRHVATRA